MSDMTEDVFADTAYGKAALAKIKPTDPNFRLYCAGVADNCGTMRVTGGVFRVATRGALKGVLSILVKGTEETVYVTKSDIGHER